MSERRAVVAGATGLVGMWLVNHLLAEEKYREIVLLVRRKASFDQDTRLKEMMIDFNQLSEVGPQLFADADVFCTMGTTIKKAKTKTNFRRVDFEYALQFAELAERGGAANFLIVTAMGACEQSFFFYSRVKGELETALSRLKLKSLHIYRPSLLLGDREEFRFGESLSMKLYNVMGFLFIGGLKKYAPIKANTVAMAMVRTALQDKQGRHVYESNSIAGIAEQ